MKKSILALLCMLFAFSAAPTVYADDDMSDNSATATTEEPLPPMTDSSMENDSSGN